jgi:hypothetical protein
MKYKDMTGKRFGRILCLRISHSNNGLYWECLCDCGNKSLVLGRSLRSGATKSCGCGSLEAARKNCKSGRDKKSHHFPFGRKLKALYRNMISRCEDPTNKRWENYGGRGIKICREWRKNRRLFYKWAIENGCKPGLSIDRIDVNGDYEPENCRFGDNFIQQNNTTRNHFVTWQDKTLTIAQWARVFGVRNQALQHRFNRGWGIKRAMTQPFRKWPKCLS